MLDHLHQKAARALASVNTVILSSFGPADIQSSRVSCAAQDLTLYVIIPESSDHLLNLEYRSGIVAATDGWELHGAARILAPGEMPDGIQFSTATMASATPASISNIISGRMVEIRPSRLTIHSQTGQGNLETIDF